MGLFSGTEDVAKNGIGVKNYPKLREVITNFFSLLKFKPNLEQTIHNSYSRRHNV